MRERENLLHDRRSRVGCVKNDIRIRKMRIFVLEIVEARVEMSFGTSRVATCRLIAEKRNALLRSESNENCIVDGPIAPL